VTPKNPPRSVDSRERWAAQIAALDRPEVPARPRKEPVTAARIVAAALGIVEAEGFAALTMRRVSTALEVTPGALYVHVRDKAELDDLMIGELCSRVTIPAPDPMLWEEQTLEVCTQLRDQYLRYPGISGAVLASTPYSLDTLRINEGLLAILLAAGASPRAASWATDAAFLYIAAYSVVSLRRHPADVDREVADRTEMIERYRMLPVDRFPITVVHAEDLISGDGDERFEAALRRLFYGLVPERGDHDDL
jgi:AcrR family transcriptional regulator